MFIWYRVSDRISFLLSIEKFYREIDYFYQSVVGNFLEIEKYRFKINVYRSPKPLKTRTLNFFICFFISCAKFYTFKISTASLVFKLWFWAPVIEILCDPYLSLILLKIWHYVFFLYSNKLKKKELKLTKKILGHSLS